MSTSQLVLVTGVSGFLGSHVVDILLKEGHRVRGTVRSSKVAAHQKVYAKHGERVEIVAIDDLINGDFTSALQGVSAVIHVASPLVGKLDVEGTLDAAAKGTTNVLIQAQKSGVKHIAVTSSIAAVLGYGSDKQSVTEEDWNPVTREEAVAGAANPFFVYTASKALAEKAVWKFADQYPDLHVTTLNPPFFIGPFAPGLILEPGNIDAFSTNLLIYNILLPDSTSPTPSLGYVDVRDVAGALVAAIRTEGKNRVLLAGEWFEHKDAVEYVASVRPELKSRLPTGIVATGQNKGLIDNSRAIEVLGIPPVRPWKESLLELVDTFTAIEKDWAAKGVDVDNVLGKNSWRK